MATALLAVAGLGVLLVGLLAVPLRLSFDARGIEQARAHVGFGWLFGLLRWQWHWPRAGVRRPRRAPREARPRRRRARVPGRLVALLRDAGLRERLRTLLADLARSVHAEAVRLHLRLGLGDPADTGRLWGLLGPVGVLARQWPAADIRIEPDFAQPALQLEASGRLRLVPLRVLALAIAFAVSPPALRAWLVLGRRDG